MAVSDDQEDERNEGESGDDEDLDGEPMEEEPSDGDDTTSEKPIKSEPEAAVETSTVAQQIDEEKRKMLREIEVKIVKYIDEIESGQVSRDPGLTIQEQAEKYRQELIKQVRIDRASSSIATLLMLVCLSRPKSHH